MSSIVQESFQYCEQIAKGHYENFPIGWFVPKVSRKFLYAVYAFARTADDFSDEDSFEGSRLEKLDEFERKLDELIKGKAEEPLFIALLETIEKTEIPVKLLKDLLKAFRLDLTKKRYKNYQELEDYCVYSANPVGRIVLYLFGWNDPTLMNLSDKICTGIQLVNHWQDISVDLGKDRIYLPQDDMKRFGYSYEDLSQRSVNDAFRSLLRFEIGRTRSLFYEGRPLLGHLDRQLRWQVSLMWQGPMKILQKIEEQDYDVFQSRPTLSRKEMIRLALSLPFRKNK